MVCSPYSYQFTGGQQLIKTKNISHQDSTNDDLLEQKSSLANYSRNSFKNKEAFRSVIRLSANHGDKDIYRETTRTKTTTPAATTRTRSQKITNACRINQRVSAKRS